MKKVSDIKELTDEQTFILESEKYTNTFSSQDSFNEELVYQYSIEEQNDIKLFNKLYGDVLYGKVDDKKRGVLPFGGALVIVPNIDKTVYCLNFVSDAYLSLKKEWKKLINSGVVKDSPDFSYTPISGFLDFESLYQEKIDSYYNLIIQFIKQKNYLKEISNFNSFLYIFSKFISLSTPFHPFSPSSFLLSRLCPSEVSGLVLTLSDKDSSQYLIRQEILQHPNFNLFNQIAKQNSFIIDKNNPSKMYFNIHSFASKKFIETYQQDTKKYYKSFFIDVQQYDMFLIFKNLVNFYNKLTIDYNLLIKKEYISCGTDIKLKTILQTRDSISQQEKAKMLTEMNSENWWRLYIFIKGCEKNVNWNQSSFEEIVKNCNKIRKTLDTAAALGYVSQTLLNTGPSKLKTRKFSY